MWSISKMHSRTVLTVAIIESARYMRLLLLSRSLVRAQSLHRGSISQQVLFNTMFPGINYQFCPQ